VSDEIGAASERLSIAVFCCLQAGSELLIIDYSLSEKEMCYPHQLVYAK